VNDVVPTSSFVDVPDVPSEVALDRLAHMAARQNEAFSRYPDEMRIAIYCMLLEHFMQPGRLKELLADLTDEEATVLVLRLGLQDSKVVSQVNVRAQLGISFPQLREVERSSILKVGQRLDSMGLLEVCRDQYLQQLLDNGDQLLSSLDFSPEALRFLAYKGLFTVNQLTKLSEKMLIGDDPVLASYAKTYLRDIRKALAKNRLALHGEQPISYIR